MSGWHDIVFLDFEASSLSPEGWPVEIGLSWLQATKTIETRSRLIRRHPLWPMSEWHERSAAVHGIDSGALEREGWEAPDVAAWYLELTAGKRVGSDAPEFERRWLRRLLDVGDLEPDVVERGVVAVIDYYEVIDDVLNDLQMDRYHERLARIPSPHRAGPDAERHARALHAALR